MRTLLRSLFHLAAAASVLLLVAAAALWVRSYWRNDYYKTAARQTCVFTQPGALWFTFADRPYRTRPGYASEPATSAFDRQNRTWALDGRPSTNGYAGYSYRGLGFACFWFTQTSYAPPCRFTYVGVPMWAVVIVTAVAPALWLRRRQRRRAAARLAGCCAHCGYDLRATPDRCPECGVPARPTGIIRAIAAALADRFRRRPAARGAAGRARLVAVAGSG